MSELNAQIPLSYVYGPTIGEHFQKAMSIADAMDQIRSRRVRDSQVEQEMAQNARMDPLRVQEAQQIIAKSKQTYGAEEGKLAREEALRGIYGADYEAIKAREATEPMPVVPEPISPPVLKPDGIATANTIFSDIKNKGPIDVDSAKGMAEEYSKKGLMIPFDVILNVASNNMTPEQFLAHEKTPGLTAWNKASVAEQEKAQAAAQAEYATQMEAYPKQIEQQQKDYQGEVDTYNQDIPENLRWLDRSLVKRYYEISALDPKSGQDFLKDMMDMQYKLARPEKLSDKQRQAIEWERINKLPAGAERDEAIKNFAMSYVPSSGLNFLPQYVNTLTKKGATIETGTRPAKVETTRQTTAAKVESGAAAETEVAGRSVPGFRPIKGVNITPQDAEKVKAATPFYSQMLKEIAELREKYKKVGTKFTGADAAWFSSKVTGLQLLAKGPELYALGVLAGPDMSILTGTLPNPASIKAGLGSKVLGDLDIKFKNFEDMLRSRAEAFYKVRGYEKLPSKSFKHGKYMVEAE